MFFADWKECVNKRHKHVVVLSSGVWLEKKLLFCSAEKKSRKKKMDAVLASANDGNHAFQPFQSWRHYPVGYEVSGMEVKSPN